MARNKTVHIGGGLTWTKPKVGTIQKSWHLTTWRNGRLWGCTVVCTSLDSANDEAMKRGFDFPNRKTVIEVHEVTMKSDEQGVFQNVEVKRVSTHTFTTHSTKVKGGGK